MKKSLLLSIILIIIMNHFSLFSQTVERKLPADYSQEKIAEGQTRWMTSQLGLNEKLRSIVYQINLKCITQVDSVRLSNTVMTDKRGVYSSIYSDKRSALQAVLTPEQYSKYLSVFEKAKKTP